MSEITLLKGVPLRVTPAIDKTITVQNIMRTTDDPLYISEHGDIDLKWMEIPPGGIARIDVGMYFMQKSWNVKVFPAIEK